MRNPKPFPPEAEALPAEEGADGRLHFAQPQRLCCFTEALEAAV